MLQFRNITVTPSDPVVDWGVEGLLTAIERGGIEHWSAILREVQRAVSAEFREELEEALAIADGGGKYVLQRALLREDESPEQRVQRRLRQSFRATGFSQQRFADELGTSQPRLSTYLSGKVVPSASLLEHAEVIAARRRSALV